MIHDLEVICPFNEKGCDWEGILDQLAGHLKDCKLS